MVEIVKINESSIELKGISFLDGKKVSDIMEICHKYKHMYLEGYPCGHKTRKNSTKKFKKWKGCPGICFTYTVTNDNDNHNLVINIFVSDWENLLKRYSEQEIVHYSQLFTQDVADEIAAIAM